jgi:hypothetical protein
MMLCLLQPDFSQCATHSFFNNLKNDQSTCSNLLVITTVDEPSDRAV